jgi:N-acetylglutamate synthase-like GNAT family acetyltransferase
MRTRLARLEDLPAIARLIAGYVEQGLLLPRSPQELRAHLDRFLVLTEAVPAMHAPQGAAPASERLIGCVALEPYGRDLAEIRSLAVRPDERGRGFGGRLLEAALRTARRRKIARVFAVTHAPELFERHGFSASARESVPEKIARDCCGCAKNSTCRLITLVAVVCPERVALPVLAGAPKVCA